MVERGVKPEQEEEELFLPPGFRFHPTDEEIITSYLLQKVLNPSFSPRAIGEVNLNKCEPWDLPSKAKMGEKEWYFFCHKDMKYPTGMRTNRATKEGYWKATGKDREIFKPASSSSASASASAGRRELVGMKKTLVFYMGRAPRGSKTNWVMHEFRLQGSYCTDNRLSPKDAEWVVCKVFHKSNNGEDNKKLAAAAGVESSSAGTPNVSSISVDAATGAGGDGDDFIDSMIDPMYFNTSTGSLLLPDSTTMDAAADYSAIAACTAAAAAAATTTAGSSFLVDLPYYDTFSDSTTSRRNNLINQQAAVANTSTTFPPVPTSSGYSYSSSSSSWNLLHAGHAIGSIYNLHDQAMMAGALGGAIKSPNFSAGNLPSSSSATGNIAQHNYSLGRGSYATNYLTSSSAAAAATVTGQQAARNLGA